MKKGSSTLLSLFKSIRMAMTTPQMIAPRIKLSKVIFLRSIMREFGFSFLAVFLDCLQIACAA